MATGIFRWPIHAPSRNGAGRGGLGAKPLGPEPSGAPFTSVCGERWAACTFNLDLPWSTCGIVPAPTLHHCVADSQRWEYVTTGRIQLSHSLMQLNVELHFIPFRVRFIELIIVETQVTPDGQGLDVLGHPFRDSKRIVRYKGSSQEWKRHLESCDLVKLGNARKGATDLDHGPWRWPVLSSQPVCCGRAAKNRR